MPIVFPCACGTTLSVRDEPPVYFVRCPKCQATNAVPHPKKKKKSEPTEPDPGFEVIDDTKPRSIFEKREKSQEDAEWEEAPYVAPSATGGYDVGETEPVLKKATQGAGEAEPYDVSQDEFEEEEVERKRRRKGNKLGRLIWIGVGAVVGIGAFVAAGQLTKAAPAGKGFAAAAVARLAILFSFLIFALVVWLVNMGGDDE